MKQFILGLLSETLNKTLEELAELLYQKSEEGEETLKEGSLDVVKKLFEDKFQKIKVDSETKLKKVQDDFHKKGTKDALERLESEIKEKYDLESESEGIELIDAVIEKFKQVDTKLTPDKVKLTDTYREREKELMKQIKVLEKTKNEEIDNLKIEFQKEESWKTVDGFIEQKLALLKLVFPKNPEAALTQKNLFKNQFKEFDYQLTEDGDEPIPIKEGKRVENRFGDPVKLSQLIEERASKHFDLAVQDSKGGAGNETGAGTTGAGDVPTKFASDEEYNKYLDSTTDPEKREKAYLNFKAQVV